MRSFALSLSTCLIAAPALASLLTGCSDDSPSDDGTPAGAPNGGTAGLAGAAGNGGSTGGTAGAQGGSSAVAGGGGVTAGTGGTTGAPPTWGIEARPTGQTCLPPATTSAQPMLLSESGCVDPADPTKPAPTLLPYAVASPLWSDNAEKHRFIALPDGMNIHVRNCTATPDECEAPEQGGTGQDDGDWDFPVGTVFMKTFALAGKLIETRLLVRKGEFDWWGFSYRWLDDQSD
ncbi:MAG TPA: hypothetical protein VGK73_04255, partial [Polyangiaceae bacterium]